MKNKILISSGDNKSHLIAIAGELSKRNFYNIYFLCSFYPILWIRLILNLFKPFIKSISRFIDRKESIDEKKVYSILISEIISKISLIFKNSNYHVFSDFIQAIGIRYYGYSSINILKKVEPEIYHFRSCYGLDSLNYANNKKLITICDHSICHPRFLWSQLYFGSDSKNPFKSEKVTDQEAESMCKLFKLMEYDLIRTKNILVNSDLVKKTCVFYGLSSKKIKVIYHGCDEKFLSYNPTFKIHRKKRKKVLFVGSWTYRKGVIELCKALMDLDEEIILTIAGANVNEIKKITPFIFHSKIKLNLYGYLSRDKLAELYSSHQIFIFPSLAEGSARVIFEALASGCFVITTPFSGSIVKNNINGFLVDAGNIKQLKNAIRNSFEMSHYDIYQIMHHNFSLVRNKYTPKHYLEKLKVYYQDLLDEY